MNTRTNIVLDDELIAQAMVRARVTTKKAAVEAALKAFVSKPDYSGLLALQSTNPIDPDYDPKGPYGLTPAALERRGWNTFDDARTALAKQSAGPGRLPVKKSANLVKAGTGNRSRKRALTPA